jgi:hypothetical protein
VYELRELVILPKSRGDTPVNDTFPEGTFCEVHYPAIQSIQEVPLKDTSTKANLPALYKALRAAKNKAEAGAAMRKFIVWNEIPEDIWNKLEEWFPTNRK